MFCKNCGSPLKENAQFCGNCGAKVTTAAQDEPKSESPASLKASGSKKKKRAPFIFAAVLIIALLVLGGLYATVGLNIRESRAFAKIKEAKIDEYTTDAKRLDSQWKKLGLADISDKNDLLKEFKTVQKSVEDFQVCSEEISAMNEEKGNYDLAHESYEAYEKKLSECADAVKEKEASTALELFQDAKKALADLKLANDDYIEDQIDTYENLDLKDAEKKVVDSYDKNLAKIQELAKSEDRDYGAIKKAFNSMDKAVFQYIEPKNPLEFNIQQVDASAFPTVKLYVSLKDPATKTVPKNLDKTLFYINKEDANQKYVKQVVTSVNQLNEKEALKINMVADVSGSMEGAPLTEAKTIMNNFINSVQFDAGDLVELTSFSTGVRLEQEFCKDPDLLINDINALYTSDMTSLYDALYTAVERVATQTGARCVIAFTDGNDNYSSCSFQDVIDAAKRYHVPVFIIGIGSINSNEISQIASQTGGAYYNIGAVNSMQNIYDEIYQMEKELYLVEFEDNTGATVKDTAQIEAGYHSLEYGGKCRYSYTPNVLLNPDSTSIYKDGPEAVVEKYLKNFPQAVTDSNFSLISDCMKSGSPIYNEQQKYVQRDIDETLDSYELIDTKYNGDDYCVISTRETYYVQVKGKALQLMTQECKYSVEKEGKEWKMTSFVDLKVTSRIKQ